MKTSVSPDQFARIVHTTSGHAKPLNKGTRGAKKITFSDGTEAILKEEDFSSKVENGIKLKDMWLREIAAYQLSSYIGMRIVPVCLATKFQGVPANIALFVNGKSPNEYLKTEVSFEKLDSQDQDLFRALIKDERELRAMVLFDIATNSTDRHSGNMLVQKDGSLVAIDHGLSFGHKLCHYKNVFHESCYPETLVMTDDERDMVRKLTKLESLRKLLADLLDYHDIEQIVFRALWMLSQDDLGFNKIIDADRKDGTVDGSLNAFLTQDQP